MEAVTGTPETTAVVTESEPAKKVDNVSTALGSKKMPVSQKFCDRMKREGRSKEWHAAVKKVMADTGKGYGAAKWDAMRAMGYTTPAAEHALYADYVKTQYKSKLRVQIETEQEEIKEERKITDFEEAVRQLPPKASVREELDWIRSHAAMSRYHRSKDKSKSIEISASDVLYADHGPAPSRAAAHALVYWANNPTRFYELLMSEDKKSTEEAGARAGGSRDVGLAEVERMLNEINAAAVPVQPNALRG